MTFHLLAKPTGAVCNLDCTYCFFLSKEMLYPGSRFRMADALLETYIRLRMMVELLRRGRYADEIMNLLALEDVRQNKPGRTLDEQ